MTLSGSSLRKLPKARAAVLRSGDSEAYRKSGADLRRGIKDAKPKSKQRTEDEFGIRAPALCGKVSGKSLSHSPPSSICYSLPH